MKQELKKLTKRQRSIFRYILRFVKKKGYPPSVRDIGKGVGLSSSSTVHSHLSSLETMGFIKRDSSKPRALKILVDLNREDEPAETEEVEAVETEEIAGKETSEISDEAAITGEPQKPVIQEPVKQYDVIEYPLMKDYSPGVPFFSDDNIENIIPMSRELYGNREGFLMRIHGRSMEGIGIFDNNLCIFEKADEVKEGEIALLIANNELTVKRVFGHMGLYRLEPENRRMNPVYVKRIEVLGKLSGVIRTF